MELKVAFLNCCSHGDCAVVTFDDGGHPACIVVDGGDDARSAEALARNLETQNVQAIDLLVGTHIDQDHINGLKLFAKAQLKCKEAGKPYVAIREFWGPMPSQDKLLTGDPAAPSAPASPGADATPTQQYVIQSVAQNDGLMDALRGLGTRVLHPALDDPPQVPFKSVAIDFLGPDIQIPSDHIKAKALAASTLASGGITIESLEDLQNAVAANAEAMAREADRDANNQSIVFRLRPATGSKKAKEWTFLFPGDAEEEAWDRMVGDTRVAPLLAARVLKIPHHGSAINGINNAGAAKVKPKFSVNSVGQKHGLPDRETLERLRKLKSAILCTQRNNDAKKKSACYSVPKADCPAKDNPQTIGFVLDTETGDCQITPADRACQHSW